jgi:tRNA-dihydrouridine synthase A
MPPMSVSSPETNTLERRGELRPISVAPMMDRTDRHFRFFLRQISRHALLYTEMKTTGAILNGDRQGLLRFSEQEHPICLQLGGADPEDLAEATRIATDLGFDEVNLNVGCPSSRVKKGFFGASLMARPELVASCVRQMRRVTHLPVTVKHRIGIDDLDSYEHLEHFVRVVASEGCDRFSVHARKAWLTGLNPKQNRTIPPLRYEDVHRLKATFPDLAIEINGGIRTYEEIDRQLGHVNAVMIGRAAYEEPMLFAEVDQRYFGSDERSPTRREIALAMLPYIEQETRDGEPLHRITRHMLTLFAGQAGTRVWKQHLGDPATTRSGADRITKALEAVALIQEAQQERELSQPPFATSRTPIP